MKALHHYLRRFCSEQVQILLGRMDDHFADEFAQGGTKWDAYTDRHGTAYDYYTTIEAYCVSRTCREQLAVYKRQQMLNGILERTMSPAVYKWEYQNEKEREQKKGAAGGSDKFVVSRAQYEMTKRLMNQQPATD